jgi:hypothetical protein
MSSFTRYMMTQSPYATGTMTGGGQALYQEASEPVINTGRVTRCVMPEFDKSKGWAGVQRGRIPALSRDMIAEGWTRTGNRCGPGGFGIEVVGPQTPFIGTAAGGEFMTGVDDPPPRRRAGIAFALLTGAVILGVASVVAGTRES